MMHQQVQSSKKMMTNDLNRAELSAVETQSVLWLAIGSPWCPLSALKEPYNQFISL
jgi:hypothetical protein